MCSAPRHSATLAAGSARATRPFASRSAARGFFALASFAAAVGLSAGLSGCEPERPPPPTLHAVPDFQAQDQAGRAFSLAQLDGQVWVANFVFTDCPSVCPMLTAQMSNFQRRMAPQAPGLRYVSISVDPAQDTPPVLAAYAARHDADLRTWRFLTLGDHQATVDLLMRGFRVRMGEREEQSAGGYDIMHASHFVLVDGERHVRGYYSTDAEGLANLEADALALLR
ncbi:MAG: SCO family protein [Polyangiales bacterium]|nr:SCO family protein [Myxococcales bacterium]MCB9660191.1 SCO family protein [Sandaracinaceae bacterium]